MQIFSSKALNSRESDDFSNKFQIISVVLHRRNKNYNVTRKLPSKIDVSV